MILIHTKVIKLIIDYGEKGEKCSDKRYIKY